MFKFFQTSILAAVFVGIISISIAQAAADNVSITSVTAQTETVEYGTAGDATFDITATGDAVAGEVEWSVSGVPGGVSASFSDNPSDGTGTWTTTLTLTSNTTVSPDSYTITIAASGDGENSDDTETTTYTISPRTISASGLTAEDKEYDNDTSATLSGSLDDVINGDDVTAIGTFSDEVAGEGKTVDVTLDGDDAAKYTTTDTLTASITKKEVTIVSGDFATNGRKYDGTTVAELRASPSGLSLSGVIGGDVVSVGGGTGSFEDKHVGTAKTVTFEGFTTTGADGDNYTLANQPANETQNINLRLITVRPVNDSKVYDGTTESDLVPTVTTGSLADGDTGAFTQTYNDPNVGTGKAIVSSGVVEDGNGGGNYTVTHTPRTNSEITALELTVEDLVANSKYYDKTTAATLAAGGSLVGIIGEDDVTPVFSGATANFDTVDVGTGKTVTVTGVTLSGDDADNYTVLQPTITGTILPRPISVTAVTASKEYDGTTSAAGTPFLSSGTLVVGDSAIYTQEFETKDAGTGKTINPIATITDGNGGENYEVTAISNTTGEITKLALLVTATGDDKEYDATTDATVVFDDNRLSGDDFTVSGDAAFDTKHVGTGKTIDVTNITLSGDDAGNYEPNTETTTTGDITERTLTVTIVGDDKVYDGTREATITTEDDRIEGDDLTVVYPTTGPDRPRFGNRNAGESKNVTVAGLSLTGDDAGNYVLFATTATDNDVDVTPAPLTIEFDVDDKEYDGTTDATINTSSIATTLFGADVVTVTPGSAEFLDKNVGSEKTVTGTGFTLDGAHKNNYFIEEVTDAEADITPRDLEVTATAEDKTYDGTTDATVEFSDNRLEDDDITVSGDAAFDTKHVGTEKTVTITDIVLTGDDAGNYSSNTTTEATADIEVRELEITATGVDKTYDGTTDATVIFGDDRVEGDDITASGTATFDDENVGSEKDVDVIDITITGDDADNYTYNTSANTEADITQKKLTVTITASDKVYDGTTAVTVVYSDDKLSGDDVAATGSVAFADAAVGTGKVVTATSITLSGDDAANYDHNLVATTTATISEAPSRGGSSGSRSRRTEGTVLGASTTTTTTSGSSSGGSGSGTTTIYQFLFDLTIGMSNTDVTKLQQILMAKGYLQIPAATGYFGPLTLEAVKKYQAANGIITTGYVGPLTRGALNAGL